MSDPDANLGPGRRGSRRKRNVDTIMLLKIVSLYNLLKNISTVLQASSIVDRSATDVRTRFWNTYKSEAGEHDEQLLEEYNASLDSSMIFAGLFCSVCATLLVLIQPNLGPDPNLTTQALLQVLILTLNGTIPPSIPSLLPLKDGINSSFVWAQSLLCASMGTSLFAAVGAMLAKQWLKRYNRAGIRGTVEDRGKERQQKLMGLHDWHLYAILDLLPLLMQLSLLLFVIGLSAYLLEQQRTIGIVYAVVSGIGTLLYVWFSFVSTIALDCPYHTPVSTLLQHISKLADFHRVTPGVSGHLSRFFQPVAGILPSLFTSIHDNLEAHDQPLLSHQQQLHRPGPPAHRGRRASPLYGDLLPAAAVSWITETSDNPSVLEVASEYVLEINWPKGINVAPILDRFLENFTDCFEQNTDFGSSNLKIIDANRDKALRYGNAFLFLYWHGRANGYVVTQWQKEGRDVDRSKVQNALKSRIGSQDELTYTSWLIEAALSLHLEVGPTWNHFKPDFNDLRKWSPPSASAFSLIWLYTLRSPRSTPVAATLTPLIATHVLSAATVISMAPKVLERYNFALMEAIPHLRSRGTLPPWGENVEFVLTRMRELQSTLPELIESGDFFDTHLGRYVSGWAYTLSYGSRENWQLRRALKEEGVHLWCLATCKEMYSAHHRRHSNDQNRPVQLDLWVSTMLSLALSIIEDIDPNNLPTQPVGQQGFTGPLSSLLLGRNAALDNEAREILSPHLHWILGSTTAVWRAHQQKAIYPPVFPRHLSQRNHELVTVGLLVTAEIISGMVDEPSVEVKECFSECFHALDPEDGQVFHAVLLANHSFLQSVSRHALSTPKYPTGAICASLINRVLSGVSEDCSRSQMDAIHLFSRLIPLEDGFELPEASMRVIETRWLSVYHAMHMAGNSVQYHALSTLNALARIILRANNLLSLAHLDQAILPPSRDHFSQHKAVLAIVCAAWSHVSHQVHQDVIKISRGAAEKTLDVLNRAPESVLQGSSCCIREALRWLEEKSRMDQDDEHDRLYNNVQLTFSFKFRSIFEQQTGVTLGPQRGPQQ